VVMGSARMEEEEENEELRGESVRELKERSAMVFDSVFEKLFWGNEEKEIWKWDFRISYAMVCLFSPLTNALSLYKYPVIINKQILEH